MPSEVHQSRMQMACVSPRSGEQHIGHARGLEVSLWPLVEVQFRTACSEQARRLPSVNDAIALQYQTFSEERSV